MIIDEGMFWMGSMDDDGWWWMMRMRMMRTPMKKGRCSSILHYPSLWSLCILYIYTYLPVRKTYTCTHTHIYIYVYIRMRTLYKGFSRWFQLFTSLTIKGPYPILAMVVFYVFFPPSHGEAMPGFPLNTFVVMERCWVPRPAARPSHAPLKAEPNNNGAGHRRSLQGL